MTSDIDELHEFAKRLGLKRNWFQLKTVPHYDLVRSKRDLAIKLGAVVVEFGQFPDDQLWCCRDGGLETTAQRHARLGRVHQ